MSFERLKKEKTKAKAAFTRTRNRLLMTLEGGLSSRQQVREQLDALSTAMEYVITTIEDLETFYENNGDIEKGIMLSNELEIIAEEFEEAELIVKGCLNNKSAELSNTASNETEQKYYPSQQRPVQQEELEFLQQEVSKQEEEIARIVKEIESTSFKLSQQQENVDPDN